jgi:flagellar biosynthesis protein FlhF
MKVKTFQGTTMADALAQLKKEFGRQAVILNTRTFTRGGLFGFGGKPLVEITAARDAADLPAPLRRTAVRSTAVRRPPGRMQEAPPGPAPIATVIPTSQDRVFEEVSSLRTLVADLVSETRRANAGSLPDGLYRTYQQLVSNAVAEELATLLVNAVRLRLVDPVASGEEAVRAALAEVVEPMVPAAGPIAVPERARPYLVALVGPTGVGKTTTIAKLAANFCLREGKKVGLITIDTYRIAAVEQLKTYAQIIDVPLEIAMSVDQLTEAVERMSDRDIVLIDTAGRSQRDATRIQQLKAFFSAVRPHEVHLVLSSAASQKVLDQTIDRFRDIGIDRLIFTKLDEALGFGVILNSLHKAQAKLSYVTTGQDVPSDIEVGEPAALTRLILATECAA